MQVQVQKTAEFQTSGFWCTALHLEKIRLTKVSQIELIKYFLINNNYTILNKKVICMKIVKESFNQVSVQYRQYSQSSMK